MKNTYLIHLAGFSLFGLTFISPTINKDAADNSTRLQLPPSVIKTITEVTEIVTLTSEKIQTALFKINNPLFREKTILPNEFEIDSSLTHEDQLSAITEEIQPDTNTYSPKAVVTKPRVARNTNITIPTTHTHTSNKTQSYTTIIYVPKNTENEITTPPGFYVDEETETASTLSTTPMPIISHSQEAGIRSYPDDLMQQQINTLKNISTSRGYSKQYALMINLGMRSGKKRFYIIDLVKAEILQSGLVAHGKGKEKFTLNRTYSNQSGSSCSSLGLYKVGASYTGSFGKSFRLIGLEKSNSNALSRAIVLHSMTCIPDEESEYPICQSEGCPSVSPNFLNSLNQIIRSSKDPILLWIFDPSLDTSRYPE
jgi:hypothetical protein